MLVPLASGWFLFTVKVVLFYRANGIIGVKYSRTIKKRTQSEIDIALNYCVDRGLYSATIFKSVMEQLDHLPQSETQSNTETPIIMDADYHTQTQTRDIEEYERYAR